MEAIATRLEAIASWLEAIAGRLEAIASRVEAIATRLEAIASWLEAIAGRLEAIASRVEAIATRLEAITSWLEAIASRLGAHSFFCLCSPWKRTRFGPPDPPSFENGANLVEAFCQGVTLRRAAHLTVSLKCKHEGKKVITSANSLNMRLRTLYDCITYPQTYASSHVGTRWFFPSFVLFRT